MVETWTALLTRSILGVLVLHARKRGERKVVPDEIPPHVRGRLKMDVRGWKSRMGLDTLDNIRPGEDVVRVTRRGRLRKYVTFTVTNEAKTA